MNPWGIKYINTGPDMSKRDLTCLSCLHRHTQSSRLISRCFREVTSPSDILLPGCFLQQVINEQELEQCKCRTGHFPLKNSRSEKGKETEMTYCLSWLQYTDIMKKQYQETFGYVVLRVGFMLQFCISNFWKDPWTMLSKTPDPLLNWLTKLIIYSFIS